MTNQSKKENFKRFKEDIFEYASKIAKDYNMSVEFIKSDFQSSTKFQLILFCEEEI